MNVGSSDLDKHTIQMKTATGTTSSMTATFLSSSLHGSKQDWSLSYLTIHASAPCVASGNGYAICFGVLSPQQEKASWIRLIHSFCFPWNIFSHVSLNAQVKLPGGEMCVPARVARTDSRIKKKAMTTWNIREVCSWHFAASFSFSARTASSATPASGGRAIVKALITFGIGRL